MNVSGSGKDGDLGRTKERLWWISESVKGENLIRSGNSVYALSSRNLMPAYLSFHISEVERQQKTNGFPHSKKKGGGHCSGGWLH